MPKRKRFEKGLGFLLADVSRLLRRDFDRRVRALEMTQAQWRAIAHIARDEGINQAALAERLDVQPITIARLIDRMQAAGWVYRKADATDRRASLLYLTPKATPILDELQRHADACFARLMHGILEADQSTLTSTLERMKGNLIAVLESTERNDNIEETGDGGRKRSAT